MKSQLARKTDGSVVGATEEFLTHFVRESTARLLSEYYPNSTWQIVESPTQPAPAEKISMIMMWSPIVMVVLKVHFATSDADRLAADLMGSANSTSTPDFGSQVVKEFSNLQGGHFRGVFESKKILVGMSLPFLVDGRDEMIFQQIRDPGTVVDSWTCQSGEISLRCSSELILVDAKPFEAIRSELEKELAKENVVSSEFELL